MDCRIFYYSFPSKQFMKKIPKRPHPMVQNIFVTEIFASNKHIFEAKNGTLSYKYIWYLVWNYLVFFQAKRIFMNKSVATINKIGVIFLMNVMLTHIHWSLQIRMKIHRYWFHGVVKIWSSKTQTKLQNDTIPNKLLVRIKKARKRNANDIYTRFYQDKTI